MKTLFGEEIVECSKGWGDRCAVAKGKKCGCHCGGHNHGKSAGIINQNKDKKVMFYLLKKERISEINVGENCMVLADFTGIRAGEKGKVTQNYGKGIMVTWSEGDRNARARMSDGFAEDELEYLAFATMKHPTKAK